MAQRKWNDGECENHFLQHSPEYLGGQFKALFDEKDNISSSEKHDARQCTRKKMYKKYNNLDKKVRVKKRGPAQSG